MMSETLEGQSSLTMDNVSCQILIVGQNSQLMSSLTKCFAGKTLELMVGETDIEVVTAATEAERLNLVTTNNIRAIIIEVSTDAAQGLRFRGKVREEKSALPILFIMSESLWSDPELLGQIFDDPYSFAVSEKVDFKTLFAKLKHCVDFGLLHDVKEMFDRNKKLAHHLQQAMLPPWVYFGKSYEFSTFYLPHKDVGGDLFEWFPLDDHRVLFIFGDVSGHETYSALAMGAVHTFMSHLIELDKEKARRPCLIANEINDYFCQHFSGIVNMAALIACFDFQSNYLCFLNAGYENMICIDSLTGRVVSTNPDNTGGIPLGLKKDLVYTEDNSVEFWFSDYSVFMFFSDGLKDLAKDYAGITFMDEELLNRLVSGLVKETQDEENSLAIPFRCYHMLQQHGYLFPQDDLTMGIIRKTLRTDKEYTFTCRVPADKQAADAICEKTSTFVLEYYQDERLSVNTELLLEEYLVNVIMHGLDIYEKLYDFIAIKMHAYDDRLQLMIWDRGKEWNGTLMQKEIAEDTLDRLNANFQGSGRGLPIISKIASRGSRQRFSGLNETIFIIPKCAEKENDAL